MEKTSMNDNLLLKKCGVMMENASIDEYLFAEKMWLHHGTHIN